MQKAERGGTVRRTITVSRGVDAEVRRRVGAREYSRFVDEAVSTHLQHLRIDEYLAEMEREYGPIPAEVEARTAKAVMKALKAGRRKRRGGA